MGEPPDVTRMMLEFLSGRGPAGATEAEVEVVERWADQVTLGRVLIEMVGEGNAMVDVGEDGEVLFRAEPVPPLIARLPNYRVPGDH
jgi:hypothetical protein